MKPKTVFIFLLVTFFFFPGCYTVLLLDNTTENASVEPAPAPQPDVEYIPVYYPISVLEHIPPSPIAGPYLLPPTYVSDSPHSTPPSTDDRRQIQTGRGPAVSNPAPVKNNNGTRDSGVQRGKR